MINTIPTSLYIHMPWCLHKCPYCDFNSYAINKIPEENYIQCLIQDFKNELEKIHCPEIYSIYIGGGTPSLFSPTFIEKLLNSIHQKINFKTTIEISMEINPGTCDKNKLLGFKHAGINRPSIGIQSFQDDKLQALKRIHNSLEAEKIIENLLSLGFNNFNLDLMHGLPKQTVQDALFDLDTAMNFHPPHISWYQLTLEQGTEFANLPPELPDEESTWEILQKGNQLLANNGFHHYEISGYAKPNYQCQHNLNYWQFGDYIAIGSGAHGKRTTKNKIVRYAKLKNPNNYMENILNDHSAIEEERSVTKKELPLEFMMNALRLIDGVPIELFQQCTGLSIHTIEKQLIVAKEKGLIKNFESILKPTELGQQFLNELLEIFIV